MANWGASNLIFINGTSGVDTFSGSSVADIFQPYAEADTFIGNGGAGEFRLINTSSAGMNFDSGTDTDFISLFGTATSSFDLATTAIANVEKLKFTGGTHTATLDHCKSVWARSTLWLLRRKPARI